MSNLPAQMRAEPSHWANDYGRPGEPSDIRCTRCGGDIEAMRADVICPAAPAGARLRGVYSLPTHPAHGVDVVLFTLDPIYHARIYATAVLMRRYRVPR